MKISIFASIGAQNVGDELILKNEIKLLENEYGKDTQFLVFSYDYKNPFFVQDNIKYGEYFPIGIKNKKNLLKNIINFLSFLKIIIKSDLIVIGGGGIIYDTEKQTTKNPLDSWIFRRRFFRLFLKKVYFFAVGINIKNKNNLKKVKKIFKKSFKITVRDSYSFNLLNKLGIKSTQVKDSVFYDNNSEPQDNYLIEKYDSTDFNVKNLKNINFQGKKIALALRKGYLSNNGSKLDERFEEGKINEIINYILKSGGEIILLPHSFHKTDRVANDYLFLKQFLRKNKNISICETMNDVYNKYKNKEIDLCLAMRLHSIILSNVYKIPFIGISYSTKTDEVLNSL